MEDAGDQISPTADLRDLILECVGRIGHNHVVSTNKVIDEIRQIMPECGLGTDQLAKLIGEVVLTLDMVPVFDPKRVRPIQVGYGYGHPAHRPNPDSAYAFEPGPSRCLPVDPTKRWRVSG